MKRRFNSSIAVGMLLALAAGSAQAATLGTGMTKEPAIQAPNSAWAQTATRAEIPTNATFIGPLNPATPLRVVLGLQLPNPKALNSLVKAQNTPGNALFQTHLTPAQFTATYSPTSVQVAQLTSYLSSKGFTSIAVEPNNLLVSATAPAASVSAAFHTTLALFSQGGRYVYSNTTPAFVPAALGNTVLAVIGLNSSNQMAIQLQKCKVNLVTCVSFYDADTIQHAYDVGTVPAATNTTLAVMAEGNVSQVLTDLRFAESHSKPTLPQVPYSVVQVGLRSPDTAGLFEWDLDTQSSSGIAQNLKHLYVYATTSLTDSDIALEYNKWVTQNVAQIGNSSFGECEIYAYLDGSMLVDDEEMLEGAAQGQTMFVSTGDTGAGQCSVGNPNGAPAGVPFAEYPSVSPYVNATGGTDLFHKADGSYNGETAWESGGGGISQFEYSPYWECGVQPQSQPATGCALGVFSFRGEPDVAMDASLETGYLVYQGGSRFITGGTSLSSPLAAGAFARMQTADNNGLGFGTPKFYKIYDPTLFVPDTSTFVPTSPNHGFHDIFVGQSGALGPLGSAKPDWDYVTGLGSFDIGKITPILKRLCPKTL